MLYNESGKFQVSKPDFKDFVIKMKKLIIFKKIIYIIYVLNLI